MLNYKREYQLTVVNIAEWSTYIYAVVHIPNKQVPEYAGLIEIPQAYHVLYALYGGCMHVTYISLAINPVFPAIIIDDFDLARLRELHLCPDGHSELPTSLWLQPNMITLANKHNSHINALQ